MNRLFLRLLATLLEMLLKTINQSDKGLKAFLALFAENIRQIIEILTDKDKADDRQMVEIFRRNRGDVAKVALLLAEEEVVAKVDDPEKRAALISCIELLRAELPA